MRSVERSGTFQLGDLPVRRLGYGAMHLSGAGIFGPPEDRDAALAVLREAVAAGVNHIDTSDYYGPHITNQLIREALHPYPADLVIATKVGARRGNDGSVLVASSPDELMEAVHDNLRNLDVDVLAVVNLRNMFDDAARAGQDDRRRTHRTRRPAAAGTRATHRTEQRHSSPDCGGTADMRHRVRAEPLQPDASERR
jgi:pyridoxine 4-dehydrogenase